jgi:hypothetical protein
MATTISGGSFNINVNGPGGPGGASGSTVDQRFLQQSRYDQHNIRLTMYNELEGFEPLEVPFNFVHTLAIEESLSDWCVKGWVILKNDFELFERGSLSYKTDTQSYEQVKAPLMFRTDGRNRMNIDVYPIQNPGDVANSKADYLPPQLWSMNFDVVIYDIEDLPTKNARTKLRKYYFYDERYQIFSERNIQWSTATYGNTVLDNLKCMTVSEAIKSIISTAASNNSDPFSPDLKVGLNPLQPGGTLLKAPNTPLNNFDINQWDAGAPDSLIFYTSPSDTNVLDDLNYVYSNSKGSDKGPVFLRFGRWLLDKSWKLIPLKSYLENSSKEEYQIERIFINDGIPGNQGGDGGLYSRPYKPRADLPSNQESSPVKNFISGIASTIDSYHFSPMVALDDALFVNRPLHYYDFASGQWQVYYEENSFKNFISMSKEFAQSGLYAYQKSNQLLINANKTKLEGLMTTPEIETQVAFNPDKNNINMMKDFLFLNQLLCFTAPGLVFRQPGKVLFVDKANSTDETNPFDDRFLGQWIMTRVTHVFTQDNYKTDVVASKIDAFEKYWEAYENVV